MKVVGDPISVGALQARLVVRRLELEDAVRDRISAIADPGAVSDPSYLDGLRDAVTAALDYGLGALAEGGRRCPPVPLALLSQARMAARNGVSLDTVMRRYAAGYALLRDLLLEEAAEAKIDGDVLKQAFRIQAARFDAILAAVSEEYSREAEERPSGGEERRGEIVESLLAGELHDLADLTYPFERWHLGLVATGNAARAMVRELASDMDRDLLIVDRPERTVWAWLGGRRPFDPELLDGLGASSLPAGACLAVGEAAQGLGGWRLTHRQAAAALPIAARGKRPVALYSRAPLLASILRDELLATSLRKLYIEPLQRDRDGGTSAKSTLRAYLAAGGNLTAAAARLGVSRRTVSNRLVAIEDRIGHPLDRSSAEIETALRLDEIEDS